MPFLYGKILIFSRVSKNACSQILVHLTSLAYLLFTGQDGLPVSNMLQTLDGFPSLHQNLHPGFILGASEGYPPPLVPGRLVCDCPFCLYIAYTSKASHSILQGIENCQLGEVRPQIEVKDKVSQYGSQVLGCCLG